MKTNEELNALKEEELEKAAGGNSWNDYWGEEGYFRPKMGADTDPEK